VNGRGLELRARRLPAPEHLGSLPVDREWVMVHRYPATSSDGHAVEVSCSRYPAIFWRVECPDLRLTLTTGSDMHDLAHQLATAIAGGMLGVGG
jgi:hypothetical protein